jgi:hypothetical protein
MSLELKCAGFEIGLYNQFAFVIQLRFLDDWVSLKFEPQYRFGEIGSMGIDLMRLSYGKGISTWPGLGSVS